MRQWKVIGILVLRLGKDNEPKRRQSADGTL